MSDLSGQSTAPEGKPAPRPNAGEAETVTPEHAAPDDWATLPPREQPAAPVDRIWPEILGYEILGELGRGGMGVVYKAKQLGLNRVVALKMILSAEHASPEQLVRFRAEAEAVARLQHLNIVQIYEIGASKGCPYFSLEYVDGGSLRDMHGRLWKADAAARLVVTLAEAMHYAHERGIIHRDLKPANVLLTADGTPKITDFGLAKRLEGDSGQTKTGQILGTPSYMAPEQAGGKKREIDPTTDVYALGAVLYELLTGRPPFQAETPLDTLLLLVTEEVTPPSELCRAVPHELEAICLKCLQKNQAHRYADAGALADDLQKFLNGEPVSACSATIEVQARRWLRKHPLSFVIITLMACLALSSGVALTYIEPSTWLVAGWVIWIATVTALFFRLPDRRGLAVAGFCTLLLAHVGWQSTAAARPSEDLPYRLSMAWIDATTALFFLLPTRRRDLALAGFSSLVFGLAFIGIKWQEPVEFLLHPIGVAGCCIVARLIARAMAADAPTAVFAGVATGMLAFRTFLLGVYPGPDPISLGGGIPIHKIEAAAIGSAIPSLAICACGVFLTAQFTSARMRQWWSRTIRRMVSPLAAVRIRVWLGIAAAPLAVCLLLLLGRGLWFWATDRELFTLKGHPGPVFSVAFSPDGERLAVGVWRTAGPERAASDDILVIWNVKTGSRVYGDSMNDSRAAEVYRVTFSPDGQRLAVASFSSDSGVKVLAATTGHTLTTQGFARSARCLAFSADGKRLATGGAHGQGTKVWDAATWHELLTLQKQDSWVNSVEFSPDGTRIATCGISGTVKLWDATTGQETTTLRKGTNGNLDILGWLYNATFSPDGKRLAAGGLGKTVKIWDVESGQEVLLLVGHTDETQGIAFSPDGKWIASASDDHTVRVWDAATGHEWLTLRGHTSRVYSVAFSRDSKRLASGSADQTVKIWRIED